MAPAHATRTARRTTVAALAVLVASSGTGAAFASAAGPALRQAPGGSMTRQLAQEITVSVRGRTVSVHFGSLRNRATRTATIRFTRTSGRAVVRHVHASGMLRLTAPAHSRKVRVSVPSTQEWTATSVTRSVSSR